MEPSNQAAPVAAPKRSRGRGFPCTIPACPRGPLKPFTRASHLERHRTVHEWVNCRPPCGDIPCESQRAWTTHLQRCGDKRCLALLPPGTIPMVYAPRDILLKPENGSVLEAPASAPSAASSSSSSSSQPPVPYPHPVLILPPQSAYFAQQKKEREAANHSDDKNDDDIYPPDDEDLPLFSPSLSPLHLSDDADRSISPLPSPNRRLSPSPSLSPGALRTSAVRSVDLPTVPPLFQVRCTSRSRFFLLFSVLSIFALADCPLGPGGFHY